MSARLLKISGPPGSGKTMALAREALRLILEEGIGAEQLRILALTPSHQKRLEAYLEQVCQGANLAHRAFTVSTIERFCEELLRRYAADLTPDFRLLSDVQARLILHGAAHAVAAERLTPDHPLYFACQSPAFARMLYPLVDRLQRAGWTGDRWSAGGPAADSRLGLMLAIVAEFENHTGKRGLLTQPDVLRRAGNLLADPHMAEKILGETRAILVDEAQELGSPHYRLLRPFAESAYLILAGTEDLSIRRTRGADPALFRDLSRLLGETPWAHLPNPDEITCFRGNEPILWLVSRWFSEEGGGTPFWEPRPPQKETEAHYADELARSLHFETAADPMGEAEVLARRLRGCHEQEGTAWGAMVVLLRNAHDEDPLKALLLGALAAQGIPVENVGISEELRQVQRYLAHALGAYAAWDAWKSDAAEQSPVRRTQTLQRFNRHLAEWLAGLPDFAPARELQAALYDAELPGISLLAQYPSDHPLFPRIRRFLERFEANNRQYARDQSLYGLCWTLLAEGQCLATLAEASTGETSVASLSTFLASLSRLETHYHLAYGEMPGLQRLDPRGPWYAALWQDANSHGDASDAVRVISISQAQGEEYDVVCLPFLGEGLFPKTVSASELFCDAEARGLATLLQPVLDPDETGRFYQTLRGDTLREEALVDETRLMVTALTRARKRVYLSTHRQRPNETGALENVSPSPFFSQLEARYRAQVNQPSGKPADSNLGRVVPEAYVGTSVWAGLPLQPQSPLYEKEEILSLSPSGLHNFLACPRKFFYSQILELRTPDSQAAALGNVVHRLLQRLNEEFPEQPYTAERLRELAEVIFVEDSALQTLTPVQRHDLRQKLLASIDDLEAKQYFSRPYQRILAEESFEFFSPLIPRARIKGRIDALMQHGDGTWSIVDYKYKNKNAYKGKAGTRLQHLESVFEPFEAEAQTHAQRFTEPDKRNYQIPFYYWAARQDERFRGRIRDVGLQLIRPAMGEDNGAVAITLPAATIEEHLEAMAEDLKRYVVDPVLSATTLDANPGKACEQCSYTGICHQAETPDEAAEEAP